MQHKDLNVQESRTGAAENTGTSYKKSNLLQKTSLLYPHRGHKYLF